MASYDIVAKVRADMSQFIAGMKSGEVAASSFATKMGGMGKASMLGPAAAMAIAGVALFKLGESFEKAYKTIRVTTGATGEHLANLEANFKNVFAQTPASMGDVATTVSDLSVKLGLSGKPLEELSLQIIKLSRITGTELKGNIESVTTVFKNFGVGAGDQKDKLDLLFRASQESGVSVTELAGRMASSGVVLRQLGFDFDSSAALMGTFAKAGIDAGDVMPGLTFALKTAGKEGQNTAELFTKTFNAIKSAPSITAATGTAIEVFGGRAGPKLAAAIFEGKLAYEDFLETIRTGTDTISKASADVSTVGGKLSVLGHQLQLALEPLATAIFQGLNGAMKAIMPTFTSMFGVLHNLVEAFLSLPAPIQAILPALSGFVLAIKGLTALKGIMVALQASTSTALAAMAASLGQFVTGFLASMSVTAETALATGIAVEAAFLPVLVTLGVAFVAYTMFTQASRDSEAAQKEYASTLDSTTGAITEQSEELTKSKLSQMGVLDAMNASGIGMDKLNQFIRESTSTRIKQTEIERDLETLRKSAAKAESSHTQAAIDNDNRLRESTAKKVRDMGGSQNALLAQMIEQGTLTKGVITLLYDEADGYAEKQRTIDEASVSTLVSNGMNKDAADASVAAANASKLQADAITRVMEAQHAALDPMFAAIKAQSDVAKAQQEYNEKVASGKATQADLNELTLKQAEASVVYRDAIGKLDVAQLEGKNTAEKTMAALVQLREFGFNPTASQVEFLSASIEAANLKLIAMKDPAQAASDILGQMAMQGDTSSEAVKAYVENLRRMEEKLAPDDPMRKNLDDTIAILESLGRQKPEARVEVTVDDAKWTQWLEDHRILMQEAYGPNSRTRATGGLVTGGTAYLIGERGPEMFVPQGPGSIISADRVASMSVASSAPGATYITNVTANVHLPAGANGKDVVDAITKFERHNGKVFARA